jgi:hypothetical protein
MEAETTQMILGNRAAAAHEIPDKGYPGVGYLGGESTAPRRIRAFNLTEDEIDMIVERATQARMEKELQAIVAGDNIGGPAPTALLDRPSYEGTSIPEPPPTEPQPHPNDPPPTPDIPSPPDPTPAPTPTQPQPQSEADMTEWDDPKWFHDRQRLLELLPTELPGLTADRIEERVKIPRLRTRLGELVAEGVVGRVGRGVRNSPYRYRRL